MLLLQEPSLTSLLQGATDACPGRATPHLYPSLLSCTMLTTFHRLCNMVLMQVRNLTKRVKAAMISILPESSHTPCPDW